MNELLTKVFPFHEERKLYLTLLATGLYGKTLEKFVLANGSGRNGKGFTNELIMKTLGNYAYTCSNAVLLSSIKDGANQTIANMDHKRVVFYREPDTTNNQKLNTSTIKEITGGNEINARGLYSSNTKTILKATHILECNERPKMSGETDEAIAMRLIDIGFRSTFTKNLNDVDAENHIYEGDDSVKDVSFQDNHKFALFHILVEHWKEYLKANKNIDLFIPASVTERSRSTFTK
jgi:phage/plasmid-associated DNA primase